MPAINIYEVYMAQVAPARLSAEELEELISAFRRTVDKICHEWARELLK